VGEQLLVGERRVHAGELDRDVARAWADRAPEIRPMAAAAPRKEHAAAVPVFSGGKLRVVD
jgi:hypothetical protein